MKKSIIYSIILTVVVVCMYLMFDSNPSIFETLTLASFLILFDFTIVKDQLKENKRRTDIIESNYKYYQEKLTKTFEGVADGVIITNTNYEIILANKSAADALGISVDEIRNQSINTIFDGTCIFNEKFSDISKLVMESKKPFSIPRIEYKNKILEDSISPIIGFNNEVEGLIIVFSDITERIESEKRTKDLENKLYQTQKMDAIGELSGGIAHDFNNTLTSINGYIDLIDIDLESKKMTKTREFVESIKKNIESAASLTNKLMIFSKNQIVDAKVYNVNSIITGFNDIIEKGVGEGISVEMHLGSIKNILADKGQIEQILLNLILNARDAIKEKNASDPKIIIETIDALLQDSQNQEYIIIKCADNGAGMDDEVKGRIFEPFFTTKEMGQGLGLSSIYGIVRQNNGHIFVKSEKDVGTTFEIYWPVTHQVEKIEVQKKSKSNKSGNGETILFVEDNESIRDIMSKYLTKYGYNILLADNGKNALKMLDNNDIDLLITDVIMPEMGGYELVDIIKKTLPEIKVIFTSGYIDSNGKENGYTLVKKPYSLNTISQKISKILSE